MCHEDYQKRGIFTMQGMLMRMLWRSKTRCWAVFTALVAILAVLAGCATQVNTKPDPIAQPQPVVEGPSVSRFDNSREGFIINEVAGLSDASRRDFDNAVTMLHEKAFGQAIELLEKVVNRSPGVTAPYINLGMAYQQIGKLEQAEVQFKVALEMFPDHPVACNQYGLLYRKTGRFDEARKIYEQSLASFPDYYPLHRNLGILCDLYLKDLETALAHYEIYSQAMPEDDNVKLWVADLRARLGKN